MIDLSKFNEDQKKAITEHVDENLLISTFVGTGKTTVLTNRIAYLIEKNVYYPEQVLAVTFTNKAAQEMKERITKLTSPESEKMWVGTFHGISARILRMYAGALGLQQNFLILDEYDKKKLLSGVIKDLEIDEKRFPVKVCQFIISKLKEKCISCKDEEKILTFKYKDLDIVSLYQTYQMRLRAMNAVDFDDLIFECVNLFRANEKILNDIRDCFKYISVDEYQDINESQHEWLKMLIGQDNRICAVGDESQTIYGWRGATNEYMLNFEDEFNAQNIPLNQNYRCTEQILHVAKNLLIHNNLKYSIDKLFSKKQGSLPNLVKVESDRDENNHMVKTIINLQQNGINYKNIAILVRATHQMRSIEDCFIKNSVPYKIIGGLKFYERKEIKDIVAYIRWCYSLTDVISLERIINLPKRGIGEKTFEDIIKYSRMNEISLIDGMQNVANFGDIIKSTKVKQELRSFLDFSFTMHNQLIDNEQDFETIIEKIYFNSGYAEMLQNELKEDPETENRIENIRELLSVAKQFNNIEQFLEHISLVSASDDENNSNSVNIMTMHASKGLEFEYVFLPAWEEGMFPSQKSVDENGEQGVEEERRLAYVALTRAKINFYVYTAKQRFLFGRPQLSSPSRFINEMMKDNNTLNTIDLTYSRSATQLTGSYGKTFISKSRFSKTFHSEESIEAKQQLTSGVSRKRNLAYIAGVSQYQTTNYYAEQEKREKTFKVGDKVYNEKWGYGVVKMLYGKHYEVQFENTKQITKDIVKLEEE